MLPLQVGLLNLGVLALYRATPGPLSVHQRLDAIAATHIAASMLLDLLAADAESGLRLSRPAGGRAEIHQATGMVSVQLHLSPSNALARLRPYAFVESRLLGDVARDVVNRTLRLHTDTADTGTGPPIRPDGVLPPHRQSALDPTSP